MMVRIMFIWAAGLFVWEAIVLKRSFFIRSVIQSFVQFEKREAGIQQDPL